MAIHVNFGRPVPLFPLPQCALLPQQVMPLHIFEPRYRQMVQRALDGSGQIAMGVFAGRRWQTEYHGSPPVRPAVCIGQIAQHERLPDGRYNILLQGVCRAEIVSELPTEEGRLYRLVSLRPLGLDHVDTSMETYEGEHQDPTPEALDDARERIRELLETDPLSAMTAAAPVVEYLRKAELPTPAVLELVSFTIVSDPGLRYKLLAEPKPLARAEMILREMDALARLIRRAKGQHPENWPKGLSWN